MISYKLYSVIFILSVLLLATSISAQEDELTDLASDTQSTQSTIRTGPTRSVSTSHTSVSATTSSDSESAISDDNPTSTTPPPPLEDCPEPRWLHWKLCRIHRASWRRGSAAMDYCIGTQAECQLDCSQKSLTCGCFCDEGYMRGFLRFCVPRPSDSPVKNR